MASQPISLRRRIYEVLEVASSRDAISRGVDLSLMTLVVLNVAAVVIESVDSVREAYHELFLAFEMFSVIVFSTEYLLRCWVAAERPARDDSHSATRRRFSFAASPIALADLLAILPFYLTAWFQVDLRFLRALRMLRILKLTRYSAAMRMMAEVLRMERRSLGAALFVLVMVSVLVSSGIYVAEHQAQPEAFGSIPAAMWWSVVTLTSVGYGDVTPVTVAGKLFGGAVAVVGVCVVALPTGILASGFSDAHRRRQIQLEAEAEVALADGYLSREESREFMAMAERLGVSPRVAVEIVDAASRRRNAQELARDACPHCGKHADD